MNKKIISAAILFSAFFFIFGSKAYAEENATMYCYYNASLREYLYTISSEERNSLDSNWTYKGEVCTVPYVSNSPVYRLLNTRTGQHLYSAVEDEIVALTANGWLKKGVAFYVDDAMTTPVYRLLNSATGEHQFSGSDKQVNNWVVEGVAFYAITANYMSDAQGSSTNGSTNTKVSANNTGKQLSANELRTMAEKTSKENVLQIDTKDWDGDGNLEAFVVTSSKYTGNDFEMAEVDSYDSCKLWYVNANGVTLIKNLKCYVKSTTGIFTDGTEAYIAHDWYSAHDTKSTVFVVTNGNAKDLGDYKSAYTNSDGKLVSTEFFPPITTQYEIYKYTNGALKLEKKGVENY